MGWLHFAAIIALFGSKTDQQTVPGRRGAAGGPWREAEFCGLPETLQIAM